MSSPGQMSPQRKMELHLRMLYSEAFTREVAARWRAEAPKDPEARALLDSFNFERLAFEREDRVNSLVEHCRKQFPVLWDAAPEATLRQLMREFADSAHFWEPRGRTLMENYCLFARDGLEAQGLSGPADLARLVGMVSGLSAAQARVPSPWPDTRPTPEAVLVPGVVASESFLSRHSLLDEAGAIRLGAALPQPARVFVLNFADRSTVVGSEA